MKTFGGLNIVPMKYELMCYNLVLYLFYFVSYFDLTSKIFFVYFQVVSRDNHSLISAHYRMDANPLIQSLHEVVVGQRYLYLVFPNAHGDLHTYVRQRKRLRESEARRLFKQIAETVQLCHENGIVLRDLKLRKFVFANPEQ